MPKSTPSQMTVDGTTLDLILERKRVKNVNARLRGSALLVSAPVGMAEERLVGLHHLRGQVETWQ